jgi:hypothetical protein
MRSLQWNSCLTRSVTSSNCQPCIDRIDAEVARMTADGFYDGQVVYDAVAARHSEAMVMVAYTSQTLQLKQQDHSVTSI